MQPAHDSGVEGRSLLRNSYSRPYRKADDLLGAFSGDWDRNGGGCCCGGGYSGGGGEASLFSDGTLLALLAAAGLAFYILYTAITAAAAARSFRKKRSVPNAERQEERVLDIEDFFFNGLEEFEEKIDRIAEGQGQDENNWIANLYNTFVGEYGQVDNELKEEDMDGIEPPILDETWGLGTKKTATTVEDPVSLDEDEDEERAKRSVEDNVVQGSDEEKCRVDMWRCLSGVIEGGLHYMDKPEGIMGFAKKTMFKIAFHGGFSNVWTGVMSIPEARKLKKCMTAHEECISYEVIRREAESSLDPADPEYSLYANFQKATNRTTETTEKATTETSSKRKRIIVNPEFVQGMDESDGVNQFDEEVQE